MAPCGAQTSLTHSFARKRPKKSHRFSAIAEAETAFTQCRCNMRKCTLCGSVSIKTHFVSVPKTKLFMVTKTQCRQNNANIAHKKLFHRKYLNQNKVVDIALLSPC